jgi:transposase
MNTNAEQHPDDLASALALLAEERARRIAAEAEAATAKAEAASAKALVSHSEAPIARLKLEIEKVRRELYGSRSERKARLLEQMELQLEELEADAGEDELAAEMIAKASTVRAFERKRPSRKPFPEHLPRERVVIAAPSSCPCCGSAKLSKLGEDITETLEVIPRQWKVIQTVREKFTCRECERITQPPAPFHVTPRGFAGPNLLAMILFEKFAQHQPLNRQSERYAREGIDLSLSTLADQVGACAAALKPIHSLIEAYVLAAERLHADDTTVPILAKGKTDTGRIWTYIRDDRPFGGQSPPAALFYASRDRRQEHPERHLKTFTGILQADAYGGYNPLFKVDRDPGPLTQALCWAHSRRKFFVLADIATNAKRGQQGRADLTDGAGSRQADRRAVRHRTRDQRTSCQSTHGAPSQRQPAARRRTRGLDEDRAGKTVAQFSRRRGDRLHAQALAWLHVLPGRREDLPDEQCCRAGAQRLCPRQEVVALRRIGSWCRSCRLHGDNHHERQAQRNRSAGMACRCSCPYRRHPDHQARQLLPWNWRPTTLNAQAA